MPSRAVKIADPHVPFEILTRLVEEAMTPEERELINDLFHRMRGFGAPTKDRDADTLISHSVRAMPDAPYMLVQSALVQEQALEQASARIQELEDELRAVEERHQRSGSGSFLGGLFGGGKSVGTSQPATPPREAPRTGGYGDQPPGQIQQAPAPGGFLQSAMSTAAGVAGGVLVSNAIRNMLGGQAHASHSAEAQRDREGLARQDAADDAEVDRQVMQDEQDDAETDAEIEQDSGDESEV